MSIKTKLKPLGGTDSYTITVVTTPSDAVCTLTYDGNTYTSKTATVPYGTVINYSVSYTNYNTQTGSWTVTGNDTKYVNLSPVQYTLTVNVIDSSSNPMTADITLDGVTYSNVSTATKTVINGTAISYSVYNSTYGTSSGSITMDANKTLTCTGTYSTSYQDINWVQPILTSNTGNPELSVSCTTMASTSKEVFTLFDGDVSSGNYWQSARTMPATIYLSTSKAIKISSVRFMNGGSYYARTGYIARNGVNIKNFTSSAGSKDSWTVSVGSADYSNYHSIVFQSASSSSYGVRLKKVHIFATYQVETYSYYWEETIT